MAGWTADTIERIISENPAVKIWQIDEYGYPWYEVVFCAMMARLKNILWRFRTMEPGRRLRYVRYFLSKEVQFDEQTIATKPSIRRFDLRGVNRSVSVMPAVCCFNAVP